VRDKGSREEHEKDKVQRDTFGEKEVENSEVGVNEIKT
jgi:hypothetical protein